MINIYDEKMFNKMKYILAVIEERRKRISEGTELFSHNKARNGTKEDKLRFRKSLMFYLISCSVFIICLKYYICKYF